LVADAYGGPEGDHSGAPGAALRSLLDDDSRRDLLAQAPDLRLQVRLVVLRRVVLGVLAQVAPFARRADLLGDLAAAVVLERREFLVQLAQPLGRDQVGGGVFALAWHRTSLQT